MAAVVLSLHVLGQVSLGFRVSVPQIAAAILAPFALDASLSLWRHRHVAWPASAMLTGSGVALILRLPSMTANDHWTLHGAWIYAVVAVGSLGTKYLFRWNGELIFNPSNLGLVVAFLVFGSLRLEPLDFWWGPISPGLIVAYQIILIGGMAIAYRMCMLELVLAGWLALAGSAGAVAASGHCITATWSLMPLCGAGYWWAVMSSPETMVFFLFMATDPRPGPVLRRDRLLFGASVGLVSGLLMAPARSEFGAKVGLLAGLTVCYIARLALCRSSADSGPRWLTSGSRWGWRRSLAGASACGLLVGSAVAIALLRSSPPLAPLGEVPNASSVVPAVPRDEIPRVLVSQDVLDTASSKLPPGGAEQLAGDLVWALRVESAAVLSDDPDLLAAVDHGRRLLTMQQYISGTGQGASRTVQEYRFDSLRLTIVRSPGQAGARLAFDAIGVVDDVTRTRDDGGETARRERPFAATFVLVDVVADHWFIADVLNPSS